MCMANARINKMKKPASSSEIAVDTVRLKRPTISSAPSSNSTHGRVRASGITAQSGSTL